MISVKKPPRIFMTEHINGKTELLPWKLFALFLANFIKSKAHLTSGTTVICSKKAHSSLVELIFHVPAYIFIYPKSWD